MAMKKPRIRYGETRTEGLMEPLLIAKKGMGTQLWMVCGPPQPTERAPCQYGRTKKSTASKYTLMKKELIGSLNYVVTKRHARTAVLMSTYRRSANAYLPMLSKSHRPSVPPAHELTSMATD